MGNKKGFSKTGIVLVGCMIICLLLALAVVPGGFGSDKKQDLDDEDTPGIQEVVEDGSPLMIFDKRAETKSLISEFGEGKITGVSAISGNEGSSTGFSSTSQKDIKAVYKALKNVVIGDELSEEDLASDGTGSDAIVSDSAESNLNGAIVITFTLSDETPCDFQFASSEVYVLNDKYYNVAGTEKLWTIVQEISDK